MMKVLKYDCLDVTLKITLLLANKVALFYDTNLLIQHILTLSVLFVLNWFMRKMWVTQRLFKMSM